MKEMHSTLVVRLTDTYLLFGWELECFGFVEQIVL